MTALFGPLWGYLVAPFLFGVAVLLIVLALKPSRMVGLGAAGFAVVCSLVGVGMLVDAKRDADKTAAFGKCVRSHSGQAEKCSSYLYSMSEGEPDNFVPVGNGK